MNKIYLFAFLIAVASANLAVDISNWPLSRQFFNCLPTQNVTRAVLGVADEAGVIDKNFLNGFVFAKDAGVPTVDGLAIVNDTLVPNVFSASIASALPASFNGTVWLRVFDRPNLWSQDVNQRVAYLGSLIVAFKQHGVTAGIYSDANTWYYVLGDRKAGSDILKAAPVWYLSYNGVENFNDFSTAGFGTWTQPALKNYQKNAFLCSILVLSLDYYEEKTHRFEM